MSTVASPAIGARFTSHATGRLWRTFSIGPTGAIGLTGEFYGPDCEHRAYVTGAELAADYDPAPLTREAGAALPHT